MRELHKSGLLDASRQIVTKRSPPSQTGTPADAPDAADEAGFVWLPTRGEASALNDIARRYDGTLLNNPPELPERDDRPTPHAQVCARVAARAGAQAAAQVPHKWEQHDDVIVIRLGHDASPHAATIGAAFAEVFGAKAVLEDNRGVTGELRQMQARFLVGNDATCIHTENGIQYQFDASRIMFSSGNVHERQRVGRLDARGETVVDMFAGIGYFALPLAMYAGAARVVALEKNPLSCHYLAANAQRNGVADIIEVWEGDNREYPDESFADRVHMGYVGGTLAFLPKALRLLKADGGTLHVHDTAHAMHWREEMTTAILEACRASGATADITRAKVVKTYSPGVVHAVIDVTVGPPS